MKSLTFSDLHWPPQTDEEFCIILDKTHNGAILVELFETFLEELQQKGEGSGVWYDLEETDDSQAPE
jgi:hypothetical protein